MCEDLVHYNELEPVTIGGPSGDYSVSCAMVSCEWMEFRLLAIAVGDAGPYTLTIYPGQAYELPEAQPFDGTVSLGSIPLNPASSQRGILYRVSSTQVPPIVPTWIRLLDVQKNLSLRVDCAGNTSAYITVQFRAKLLTRIPGPYTTVHPDHAMQVHQERERRIQEATLGKEGEYEVYQPEPAPAGQVRGLTTAELMGIRQTGKDGLPNTGMKRGGNY